MGKHNAAAAAGGMPARQSEASNSPSSDFRRTLWRERLLSLWAPVTVFALIFAVYVTAVELDTSLYRVGKPVMDVLGLCGVAAFVALLFLRWFNPRFAALRTARHKAHEALSEWAGLQKRAQNLPEASRAELTSRVSALQAAYVEGQLEKLEKATDGLENSLEKYLAHHRPRGWLHFASGFAKALAIALLVRTVVVEPFRIPSGSMIPTLAIGDQIFINKFIYGVRIPFTNWVPFQIVRSPQRGDVVVFENPVDPQYDYVKRVVGVAGDKISLQDNTLTINGEPQPRKLSNRDFVYPTRDPDGGPWMQNQAELFTEVLEGHPHATLVDPVHNKPTYQDGQSFVVPEGNVFVMGDNRDNSTDSRYGLTTRLMGQEHLAFVPLGHIKGKAMVIWMSLSYDGFLGSLFGGTGLSTERLFLPVR